MLRNRQPKKKSQCRTNTGRDWPVTLRNKYQISVSENCAFVMKKMFKDFTEVQRLNVSSHNIKCYDKYFWIVQMCYLFFMYFKSCFVIFFYYSHVWLDINGAHSQCWTEDFMLEICCLQHPFCCLEANPGGADVIYLRLPILSKPSVDEFLVGHQYEILDNFRGQDLVILGKVSLWCICGIENFIECVISKMVMTSRRFLFFCLIMLIL